MAHTFTSPASPPSYPLFQRHYEAWLVSEMADKGSLADAIAAGTFRTGDPPALNMVRPWAACTCTCPCPCTCYWPAKWAPRQAGA